MALVSPYSPEYFNTPPSSPDHLFEGYKYAVIDYYQVLSPNEPALKATKSYMGSVKSMRKMTQIAVTASKVATTIGAVLSKIASAILYEVTQVRVYCDIILIKDKIKNCQKQLQTMIHSLRSSSIEEWPASIKNILFNLAESMCKIRAVVGPMLQIIKFGERIANSTISSSVLSAIIKWNPYALAIVNFYGFLKTTVVLLKNIYSIVMVSCTPIKNAEEEPLRQKEGDEVMKDLYTNLAAWVSYGCRSAIGIILIANVPASAILSLISAIFLMLLDLTKAYLKQEV